MIMSSLWAMLGLPQATGQLVDRTEIVALLAFQNEVAAET
jgi:hypothetical protein